MLLRSILAGILLFCSVSLFAMSDVFHLSLSVGDKWIYTEHTETIMQSTSYGGNQWYGFTTFPLPESLPSELWDVGSETWDSPVDNWMAVIGTSLCLMDKIGDVSYSEVLKTPVVKGGSWSTVVPGVGSAIFTLIERENVIVPAGTYENCWKVGTEFYKSDPNTGKNSRIVDYTWYADSVGVIKDSVYIDNTANPDCHEVYVYKLIRYIPAGH
ncbi:hypothetical protein CH333_10230 [candidate division WOR-3 bacterium JGI_Cruoil_03_44_89]|uniref:Uncharacterized protein n=1 Tax=candidate division WOR-3 bacterium JGI_Cruoil_03_44_89 TaxID=1973748 RepID=A0A235BNF9_UNCW3|nr:MAG: hypothetical protein CH333_10230 [candidate division WOR-3 bacterium JGI_Cruoil_03_44_89]